MTDFYGARCFEEPEPTTAKLNWSPRLTAFKRTHALMHGHALMQTHDAHAHIEGSIHKPTRMRFVSKI